MNALFAEPGDPRNALEHIEERLSHEGRRAQWCEKKRRKQRRRVFVGVFLSFLTAFLLSLVRPHSDDDDDDRNRRGNILAAGTTKGTIVLWCFDTRSVIREFTSDERSPDARLFEEQDDHHNTLPNTAAAGFQGGGEKRKRRRRRRQNRVLDPMLS